MRCGPTWPFLSSASMARRSSISRCRSALRQRNIFAPGLSGLRLSAIPGRQFVRIAERRCVLPDFGVGVSFVGHCQLRTREPHTFAGPCSAANRKANGIKCCMSAKILHSSERPMDIDRARTFLEIVYSGSFLRAVDRLHVTRTTESAHPHAGGRTQTSALHPQLQRRATDVVTGKSWLTIWSATAEPFFISWAMTRSSRRNSPAA